MLTIKNIRNILSLPNNSFVSIHLASDDPDGTYNFKFNHKNYEGDFIYTIHRDLSGGVNGSNNKYVGTFRHPFGSHRQDVYESDMLDKQSFIYFLETLVSDWSVQYKQ